MIDKDYTELLVELAEYQRSRYFGKYRGKVKEVGEGDKLGYITALVPEIYGPELDSPWAVPCVPFAGGKHGFVALPEVDDGVWIEFEAGDISRPIWSGGWWQDGQLPEPGGVKTRAFITTAGHQLVLDDDGKKVQLLHSDGAKLEMTGDEVVLSIGQAEIKLTGTGEILLKAGPSEIKLTLTDIKLSSGTGSIVLSASGTNINNGAINVI